MKNFWVWLSTKSLKREVATVMLGFTCYFGVVGDAEMAGIFIGPSVLFAMGAFGLDAAAKQLNMSRSGSLIGDVNTNITVQPKDSSDIPATGPVER